MNLNIYINIYLYINIFFLVYFSNEKKMNTHKYLIEIILYGFEMNA